MGVVITRSGHQIRGSAAPGSLRGDDAQAGRYLFGWWKKTGWANTRASWGSKADRLKRFEEECNNSTTGHAIGDAGGKRERKNWCGCYRPRTVRQKRSLCSGT